MAIIRQLNFRPCDESDPHDYRPDSTWAIACDPVIPGGAYVRGMAVSVDIVAPGDRVPLHTHPIDEVVFVEDGVAEIQLGDEQQTLDPGAVVFIPAGTVHGARATGDGPTRLLGVFPSDRIGFELIERNPAPGTERDPVPPPFILDVRSELEGTA